MKLYTTATFVFAALSALSKADDSDLLTTETSASDSGSGSEPIYDGSAQDASFNATAGDHAGTNKTQHIKTAANLIGSGAKIQLCPSGDCVNGQAITLSMSRLQEISADDTANKPFVQEAKNFNAVDATWTSFEPITIGDTDALTSSFVTNFTVDKTQSMDTSFNLTAVIYQANGTAMNGNQTIDVPAGALKFSITIKNWPFQDTTNRLRFGIELKAQGKGKVDRDPGTKTAKGGNAKNIDRLDMGEGMFMDAPTEAVVDDENVEIESSIEPANKKLELVWVFPSFAESLYYDPVMGSEDPSATVTDSPTTAPTTPSKSGSGSATSSTDGSTVSSTAGSGSTAVDTNPTVTPTVTASTPEPTSTSTATPTPTPSETATNTNTKTSGASALGATVLGVLMAAAFGGTFLM